jgi:hypothetical protein
LGTLSPYSYFSVSNNVQVGFFLAATGIYC